MSDNQNESKLRLRNTDTNRFKVDTGRLKVQRPQDAESAPDAQKTQKAELHDALSLRDTSTGRLRKVETAEAQAAGMGERRSETVRLKVIRHQPRIPGVSADSPATPATPVAAPSPIPPTPKPVEPSAAATAPVSEAVSEASEQKKSMTVRLKVKKPGETAPAPEPVATAPAPEPVTPAEPIAPAPAAPVPATEEKKSMTVRLKVQKPAEAPADKTTEVPPPTATSTAPVSEPLKTSTIKLNPLKPQPAPAEETATKTSTIKLNPIKPAAPAQEAAPLSSASGKPEAVKLRPATGAPVQPEAPAGNASETIKLQPNATPAGNASETIKLQPNGATSTGRKFTLKKEPEPAPSAPPAVPEPPAGDGSNAAATVVVPAPEQTGKPGLKLPGSKLKKLPADGTAPAPAPAPAPVPRQSFDTDQEEGIGALPSICAILGTVAALAIIFNLVMAMLKIM
jgi:hypothetical protein